MKQQKRERIEQEIEWLKEELEMMMIVRPGSLSKQYNVCGKPGCACKAKTKPKKHGPYYILSYRHRGKNRTEFIRKQFVSDVKEWTGDHKTLWKLVDKWIDLSIALSKAEMQAAAAKR